MRRVAGFSLLEVLIAAIVLSLLVVAALGTMRSSTGFTVLAGRQNESVSRSLEKWEAMRNEVHPDQHMDDMDGADEVPLTNVTADRAWTVTPNPMEMPEGDPTSWAQREMKEATLNVDWIEPR